MTVLDKIKTLASNNEKSINSIEEELNYSHKTLYHLKTTNPFARILKESADYFNVSVDYLLDRTKDNFYFENRDLINKLERGLFESNLSSDQKQKLFEETINFMMFTAQNMTVIGTK